MFLFDYQLIKRRIDRYLILTIFLIIVTLLNINKKSYFKIKSIAYTV